jgi:D-aminopeptidase
LGTHNLITDVAGVRVGNAEDARAASGVTAIVFDTANVASGVTRGGAPGTRDTTLLDRR